MNKTILIAGGAAVASLAVGTAGGYLFAKKRFEQRTAEEIAREVDATKKYYSVLLMQVKEQKPDSPADLVLSQKNEEPEADDEEEESDKEELSAADRKAFEDGLAKVRENRQRKSTHRETAEKAQTDYQGISTRKVAETSAASSAVIDRNIFADAPREKKKPLPPRGEGGSFRKRTVREMLHEPPQIIDAGVFLLNDPDHNQESLYYFANEKTLVSQGDASESIDLALIGEVNLTLFPEVSDGEPSMIYVRNVGLSTDYEVMKMTESLTDFIGLGTEGGEEIADTNWV